ncbi:GNAT family N-acetyltransferase [Bdellovibrio sp. HCB2-146]|uniref:GNAT family N-acetyltransferase n=1 Tax=Bdellovibrio sp. HCB2-146 TaxID=3394362 RepID=UPI0039BD4B10
MDVQNSTDKKEFYAVCENGEKATLKYNKWNDTNTLELVATFVPPSQRGKNIGELLLKEALRYADQYRLKIEPTCPYVKSWFAKHPGESKRLAQERPAPTTPDRQQSEKLP